jgi:S-formylglutathione hydrolase FrmB
MAERRRQARMKGATKAERSRARRRIAVGATTTALVILASPLAAPAVTTTTTDLASGYGITVQAVTPASDSVSPADERLLDVTVTTQAVAWQPVHVRIYLPSNYATATHTSYPVLYLLHGGADTHDDAASWTDPTEGNIAGVLGAGGSAFRGIVVMPEAGKAGWYTDWAAPDHPGTPGNPAHQPLWETFHIEQLIPWIDQNFRTIRTRNGRAVAGISMGGFGALSYAEQFPSLFSAVGSFSGTVDLNDAVGQIGLESSLLAAGTAIDNAQEDTSAFRALDPQQVFGPYGRPEPFPPTGNWGTHNPLSHASSYVGTKVGIYLGNGIDTPRSQAAGAVIEASLIPQTLRFHHRLDAAGASQRFCMGNGYHAWSYWRNDLADFLAYAFGTAPTFCPNGWGPAQS